MAIPRIVSCTIGPYPKKMLDPMPKVVATFDDGNAEDLFEFYPDEISFKPEEFLGLTREQAFKLHHDKDVTYLRAP